jgi:hypothetical protein
VLSLNLKGSASELEIKPATVHGFIELLNP